MTESTVHDYSVTEYLVKCVTDRYDDVPPPIPDPPLGHVYYGSRTIENFLPGVRVLVFAYQPDSLLEVARAAYVRWSRGDDIVGGMQRLRDRVQREDSMAELVRLSDKIAEEEKKQEKVIEAFRASALEENVRVKTLEDAADLLTKEAGKLVGGKLVGGSRMIMKGFDEVPPAAAGGFIGEGREVALEEGTNYTCSTCDAWSPDEELSDEDRCLDRFTDPITRPPPHGCMYWRAKRPDPNKAEKELKGGVTPTVPPVTSIVCATCKAWSDNARLSDVQRCKDFFRVASDRLQGGCNFWRARD